MRLSKTHTLSVRDGYRELTGGYFSGIGFPAVVAPFFDHWLYQLIIYSCVRMKFDGREPVP